MVFGKFEKYEISWSEHISIYPWENETVNLIGAYPNF